MPGRFPSMSNDLFRLIYVSTVRPGLSDADMTSLLNTSQSNNEERFLTGYLVHNEESFMQLIEGPRLEVAYLFRRILQDDRHTGVVRILAEQADRRAFPGWPMNYFRVDSPGRNGWMLVRRDDPVDGLIPAQAPRDLIYAFSKFIHQD